MNNLQNKFFYRKTQKWIVKYFNDIVLLHDNKQKTCCMQSENLKENNFTFYLDENTCEHLTSNKGMQLYN